MNVDAYIAILSNGVEGRWFGYPVTRTKEEIKKFASEDAVKEYGVGWKCIKVIPFYLKLGPIYLNPEDI